MPQIFYPSAEDLGYLLLGIHNRDVALPDFQRDFVWDPRATEELIESITQNYPAGSLLRIKNSSTFFFAPREVSGAPALNGQVPAYLVLDGQQRLTSLYQAFYGKGSHRYFLNLQSLLDGNDLEDSVFHLRESVAIRRYGRIDQQAKALVLPMSVVFSSTLDFEEWLDQILVERDESDAELSNLKTALRSLKKKWINTIEDYQFPVVTLAEDTEPEAVCTIFETLNRTGVKLSVFDLLAARFWVEEIKLRELWDIAKVKHTILEHFKVDPYYILQSITIYSARGAPSCKRGDVLKLSGEDIQEGWDPVVKGMVDVLHMLQDECGVVHPKWLPYNPMLIPAAATFAKHERVQGPKKGAIRSRLKRWFWCSVFSQVYEQGANSQAVKDATELSNWIAGGSAPDSVRDFKFESDVLRETTPRQRGIYRGCVALILRDEARDFHSGQKITAKLLRDSEIDDHHVFPKGFLNDNVSTTLRDCVLNRTLIDKVTNQKISNKSPSLYLSEIEDELGTEHLKKILRSHVLPSGENSSLREDRFDDFLEGRQSRLLQTINNATETG